MNLLQIMLKTAGGILAFAGSCGCGIWLAAGRHKRIEILREMEQVFIILYGEIEYAGADIVEILQGLSGKTVLLKSFFERMYKGACQVEDDTLYELWDREVENSEFAEKLDKTDIALWRELGKHLGILDRRSQLQTLRVLQKRLQTQLSGAEAEYKAQAKVYRLTGVTAGIFLVILLI